MLELNSSFISIALEAVLEYMVYMLGITAVLSGAAVLNANLIEKYIYTL